MKKIQILAIVLLIPAIQGLSKTENLIIEKLELNPPQNLTGSVINNNDVLLEWSPPIISKALRIYENGINSSKDLLGYTIYKDSINIGFTSDTSFLDQDILPGEYEYFVTAFYDEGESVPSNSVWIISSGPCDPPVNVMATVITEYYVEITWEPPITGNVTGFNLYMNGALLGFTTGLSYTTEIWTGTYQFCVSSVCVGVESEPACADSVTVTSLLPPENLNGYWLGQLYLFWDPPVIDGELIQWDSGENNGNGVGYTNGGTFSCASHWTPDDLAPYNGFSVDKILFWPNTDPNATFEIKVWTGSAGTNLVTQQNVESYIVDQWNEVILATPILINSSTDLWFGYTVTHAAGTFPAGCDDGPAIQGKGDMISIEGAWVAMSSTYGLDYNWNIAGYVTHFNNSMSQELLKAGNNHFDKSLNFSNNNIGNNHWNNKNFATNKEKSLLGYNVYQSINCSQFYPIGFTEETHYSCYINLWELNGFYVTGVYDEGESVPSDTFLIAFPAIEENLTREIDIYPNPSGDWINISSDQIIKSFSIYQSIGQLMKNHNVNDNSFRLNVSNFNPGIYFLKFEFSEGFISKRIVVE